MSILRFFGLDTDGEPPARSRAETETVRKITAELDKLEPERARFFAAFAYILSRVARADLHVSPEETARMEKILVKRGGIPEEQAVIVVQMAKNQNLLFGGTENYLVTREFEKMAGREEKIALVHCLFEVSAADGSISTIEDNEISQIATELRLDHKEFIAIRSCYRDHLAVLKKNGEP